MAIWPQKGAIFYLGHMASKKCNFFTFSLKSSPSISSKSAHVAQYALGTVGVRLVRVTTTLALAVDILAFSVRQILQQILHAAFAPIRQLDSGSHGFDLLDDGLANEFGPVAFGAIQIRDGANVGATRAVLVTASFLVHVDVKAAFFFVALAATNAETAQAAFLG